MGRIVNERIASRRRMLAVSHASWRELAGGLWMRMAKVLRLRNRR